MHLEVAVTSVLFTSSLANLVTPTSSTLDPIITPGPNIELFRKQNNARYMGWVAISGIWSSQQCEAGATYFQSGGHWRCCATTAAGCEIPQACVSGNLIYDGAVLGRSTSVTFPCTSVYPDPTDKSFTICNTAFMYENDQDSTPQTNVNCGRSSVNWSYYRAKPEAAKTTSRSSVVRPTSAVTASLSSGDTDTSSSTLPSSEKSSSKAWIAGAVIGPLFGLAIIAFFAWFCIRRKKKTKAAAAAPPTAYNPQPQQAAPIGPTSPPQYFSPPMQQQSAAPFGVADGKPNTWTPQPQSPVSQASSPHPLSMYGNQYPQQGGYGAPGHQTQDVPSPSMSPHPPSTQTAYAENNGSYQHVVNEPRPFSSELDGSPQIVNVQPKQS